MQLIGSEIYVTNAGSNLPIITELSSGIPVATSEGGAGRGQSTGLEATGNCLTLVAVITTGETETENPFATTGSGIDASLVVSPSSTRFLNGVPNPNGNGAGSGSNSNEEDEDGSHAAEVAPTGMPFATATSSQQSSIRPGSAIALAVSSSWACSKW